MKYDDLHKIDPYKFEIFVAQLFSVLGYNVLLTNPTSDGGIDIIVDKYDANFEQWVRNVIQVKRYKSDIGIEKVRELNGVLPVHNAQHGILLTLAGFKKGIVEKVKKEFPHITLKNNDAVKELLQKAKMLDIEGELIFSDNNNAEKNRKFTILKILREKQPRGITSEELITELFSKYHITVPEKNLLGDIDQLEEMYSIIQIEKLYYYSPKQSEIQLGMQSLFNTIITLNYFFSYSHIYEILETESRINKKYWLKFYKTDIEKTINDLIIDGKLFQLNNGIYATPKAIEDFRDTELDEKSLLKNLNKIIGYNDSIKKKSIKNSDIYPKERSTAMKIFGIGKNSKKLLPFLEIMIARCPHCDRLHISISEPISIIVTTDKISANIDSYSREDNFEKFIEELQSMLQLSGIYIERIKKLIPKYFKDCKMVSINLVKHRFIHLDITLDSSEKSSMLQLRDQLFTISKRFQTFMQELSSPINNYGKPKQLIELKIPQTRKIVKLGIEE